jgi:hypothetical protein
VKGLLSDYGKPVFKPIDIFPITLLLVLTVLMLQTVNWEFGARIVPLFVGALVIPALAISLANEVFRRSVAPKKIQDLAGGVKEEVAERLHMDIAADHGELPMREVLRRAGIYLGWVLFLMFLLMTVGFLLAAPIFVIAYMRVERKEPWLLAIAMGVGLGLFFYIVFDQLLNVIWPETYLGNWFPDLSVIPSV